MGKKRKKKREAQGVDFAENFDSIIENIQKEIRSLNKSNNLIVGTNAVLRGLEKNSLSIVMLNPEKASSAIYHSLKMWCKKTGVLFISLKTGCELLQDKKLLSSATFGVKKNELCINQKLSDLLRKINFRLKHSKRLDQNVTCSTMDDESFIKSETLEEINKFQSNSNVIEHNSEKDYYHSKCIARSTKLKNENFLSLETNLEPNVEFINYEKQRMSNFSVHVR
ncbi:uncharacterized protein LOC129221300 [Uloborus diversus]|uniref:uncharacterized protein LOC129221300 n=1 Tax=Uloborus diversus TaxID=327109 RepID=UPI002409C081|nr:uncharacterized protein LOC129221300 [Uloborus diversus]